jgi:hypothetical protein
LGVRRLRQFGAISAAPVNAMRPAKAMPVFSAYNTGCLSVLPHQQQAGSAATNGV